MGANVFLSYISADRAVAERVAQQLAEDGITTVTDREFPPGEGWADALRDNLARSDALVAVLSDASLDSMAVMSEVGAAIALDKKVMVIRPKDATLPPMFSARSPVGTLDAGTMSDTEIAKTIIQTVRAQLEAGSRADCNAERVTPQAPEAAD